MLGNKGGQKSSRSSSSTANKQQRSAPSTTSKNDDPVSSASPKTHKRNPSRRGEEPPPPPRQSPQHAVKASSLPPPLPSPPAWYSTIEVDELLHCRLVKASEILSFNDLPLDVGTLYSKFIHRDDSGASNSSYGTVLKWARQMDKERLLVLKEGGRGTQPKVVAVGHANVTLFTRGKASLHLSQAALRTLEKDKLTTPLAAANPDHLHVDDENESTGAVQPSNASLKSSFFVSSPACAAVPTERPAAKLTAKKSGRRANAGAALSARASKPKVHGIGGDIDAALSEVYEEDDDDSDESQEDFFSPSVHSLSLSDMLPQTSGGSAIGGEFP